MRRRKAKPRPAEKKSRRRRITETLGYLALITVIILGTVASTPDMVVD